MKRKHTRAAVVVLATIFGLLLAYPLSLGPVCFLFQYVDWGPMNSTIQDGIALFYAPLELLPEPMSAWIDEWWNYGMDLGRWAADG
ncbi:MAG TPA: hypothetical protein VHC22_12565 [Pirellulales bacterium]|nr:hypothetical protein [Pirellulales bacterium]